MGCDYCNKSWVHGCWTAAEAAYCGNMDADTLARLKKSAKVADEIEERRRGPAAEEIEARERRELARLKAKYENK